MTKQVELLAGMRWLRSEVLVHTNIIECPEVGGPSDLSWANTDSGFCIWGAAGEKYIVKTNSLVSLVHPIKSFVMGK